MPSSHHLTQDIAELLREAYRQSSGLPLHERDRVLKICLAYQLKGKDRREIETILRQLSEIFALGPSRQQVVEIPQRTESELPELEWTELLTKFIRIFEGDSINVSTMSTQDVKSKAERILDEMTYRLSSLSQRTNRTNQPPLAVLEAVEKMLQVNDKAMEQAAQESFDRLLSAFDPESAKLKVSKKMFGTSTSYKASLYDSVTDKYHQLKLYHDKGRLVRDYRAIFKKYLKQNLLEMEKV